MHNYLLKNSVARRDFLKGCSYVAATALLGGCDIDTTRKSTQFNPSTDDILDDVYSLHIHPSAEVLVK